MDAHFENIVSDGKEIYLTDFGLAISDEFELNVDERAFFHRHRNFDRATILTSLVHAIFTRHTGESEWREAMRSWCREPGSSNERMPEADRDFLIRRGPLWLEMMNFYEHLRADIRAPFPTEEIERLLVEGHQAPLNP